MASYETSRNVYLIDFENTREYGIKSIDNQYLKIIRVAGSEGKTTIDLDAMEKKEPDLLKRQVGFSLLHQKINYLTFKNHFLYICFLQFNVICLLMQELKKKNNI